MICMNQDCPQFCDVCSDTSTCTTCQANYYLDSNGDCVSPCPPGTFVSGKICASKKESLMIAYFHLGCSQFCDVCSDSISCQTCQPNYYLYQKECIAGCPTGTMTSGSSCVGKHLALSLVHLTFHL